MISIERRIPKDELIDQIRGVTMLHDKSVHPYQNADIDIERVAIDSLLPIQLYALRSALIRQRELREDLKQQGHDPLELTGGLVLNNEGYKVSLIPPLVEEDDEYGPCLVDGLHRVYEARKLGIHTLNILRISDVLPGYPLCAFPNRWDEIVEYDQTPPETLKRRNRPSLVPGDLYRNLSVVNSSKKRRVGMNN